MRVTVIIIIIIICYAKGRKIHTGSLVSTWTGGEGRKGKGSKGNGRGWEEKEINRKGRARAKEGGQGRGVNGKG